MDLSRGCVLLARSLDESDIFQNEKWLKVWIWCLIQANHKKKNVPVNTGRSVTVVKVERGQFIFGRHTAAKKLKPMKPSTIWFAMQKLEKLGNLDINVNSHYSLVTVLEYDNYQNMKNYVDKHLDNHLTGNRQPTDTTNTPNTPNTPNKEISYPEEFIKLWTDYPNTKGSKSQTFKNYQTTKKSLLGEQIYSACMNSTKKQEEDKSLPFQLSNLVGQKYRNDLPELLNYQSKEQIQIDKNNAKRKIEVDRLNKELEESYG